MITQRIAAAIVATLLLTGVASAQQSAADLLQKGIHAQETVGDLDGAIQIFRQVVASPNTNKQLAAQAQYQLVLCVLQKGDRPGASQELQLLEKNFADQPDLIEKARKLIPGANSLLPAPWLDGELLQLNIKREGAFTGETLTYSADPWRSTVAADPRIDPPRDATYPNSVYLRWELTTAKSMRSIQVRVDRDTLRPLDKQPEMHSDDMLGDTTATPFVGPATDLEESVFTIRRLPLAVGYKTTIPVTEGLPTPVQAELSVTGIETVQVPAGKFNCYKISFAALGQTLWIAVDGARPLVKFQSGDVSAELAKTWGATNPLESALGFVKTVGWAVSGVTLGPGPSGHATINSEPNRNYSAGYSASVTLRRVYTPAAEIPQALEKAISEAVQDRYFGANGINEVKSLRPGSLQRRLINGQQAASFLIDLNYEKGHEGAVSKEQETDYCAVIQTENNVIVFRTHNQYVAVFRWLFDPILATAKIP